MNYYDIYLNDVEVDAGVNFLMPWFEYFYLGEDRKERKEHTYFKLKIN